MAPAALTHRGVRFSDPSGLARQLAPELRAALRRGDSVAAALDAPSQAALLAEMGADAGELELVDPTRPARIDAFQLAATRAARVSEIAAAGRGALFVGQNQPGLGLEEAYWCRLEAALHVALADLPVTLLCPYRTGTRSGGRALRWVHPEIVGTDGTVAANPERRSLDEVVAGAPPPPLPDLGAPDAELTVDRATLAHLRRRFGAAVAATGHPIDDDLVYALSEVATNSVEHGAGAGRIAVWVGGGSGGGSATVCEVADAGRLSDPFPGVRPPTRAQVRGRGIWLARTLCAAVDVRVDEAGTRVRLTGHI